MKKVVLGVFLSISSFMISPANAKNICVTSSNANNNVFFCRALPDGGDWCYALGSGTACSGTGEQVDT